MQDFIRIAVFKNLICKPSDDASQKPSLLESNVTPNISKTSASFNIVPSIVNGGNWGCIVRDKETIIVLDLFAFKFIPHQRSHEHYSLTLTRAGSWGSVTVTLTLGDGTTAVKVEISA